MTVSLSVEEDSGCPAKVMNAGPKAENKIDLTVRETNQYVSDKMTYCALAIWSG